MAKAVELTAPLGFLILHELQRPSTGTELAKKIGERKGGLLTPGTIYPALKDLHKKKLITYRTEGREKRYSLRKEGEEELAQLYNEFARLFLGLKTHITRKNASNA